MQNIIPIFKTQGSIGKSILTCEDETEVANDAPVSIISIAKKHSLKEIIVIDDSFLCFPKLYKYCKKHDINLIFGVNFIICNDVSKKDDDYRFENCKVSVLMKNSEGYKDLIKLHDAINANADNFYYTLRGDWKTLNKFWTQNLDLWLPPYDNFIHNNLLMNGKCIPSFDKIIPHLTYANMELPYDNILSNEIKAYAKNNNYLISEVHPVYYYSKEDSKAYNVFRCINNRSLLSSPELNFFSSDKFNFESFLEKLKI